MATRMGIRELRDSLTQTIRRVRSGEVVEVTHDGEPVARIVPIRRDRLAQLVAEGRATAGRPFRPPLRLIEPRPGTPDSTRIIREGRDDP
jgi:prevent-host-death family protein